MKTTFSEFKMPRARRWAKLVNWQRQGGRLARLGEPQ